MSNNNNNKINNNTHGPAQQNIDHNDLYNSLYLRLQNGETPDQIAADLSTILNTAKNRHAEEVLTEKRRKQEQDKEEQKKKELTLNVYLSQALDNIHTYIKLAYPSITDESLTQFAATPQDLRKIIDTCLDLANSIQSLKESKLNVTTMPQHLLHLLSNKNPLFPIFMV